MIASTKSPSRFTEITVLILGMAMIAGPTAILTLNIQLTEKFFGSKDMLSLSPIGEVLAPKRVVRRRGDEEPAFKPAKVGDPVFVGDTIITGKDSSTRISLSDGSQLELGPESMIKIEPIRSFSIKGIQKKLKVTVQSGTIKAKPKVNSEPILIQSSAGETLTEVAPPVSRPKPTLLESILPFKSNSKAPVLAPSLSEVVVPEPEFVSITAPPPPPAPAVAPITAPIAAPAAKSATTASLVSAPKTPSAGVMALNTPLRASLKPEDLAQIPMTDEEAKASVKPLVEKPVLSKIVIPMKRAKEIEVVPTSRNLIVSDTAKLSAQSLTFKWKHAGAAIFPKYTLFIDLEGNVRTLETEKTEYTWSLPLQASGKVTWWVEANLREGGKIESEPQSSSWTLPTPVLASPDSNLTLPDFYIRGESREVLLTWKQMPICKNFEIQVSRSKSFTELSFSKETVKHFQGFPVLDIGQYFWRVGCVYTDDFRLFSSPRNFFVQEKKKK